MSLRSYLLGVANSKSIEDLWEAHVVKMAEYGFDRLLYGFTHYRTSTSLGDPSDFIILTNHSRDYVDVFLDEGHYFHAPMVHWALANEGAKSWKLLSEMDQSKTLSPSERRVLEFNRDMGVTAGYSISFKSISARSKGAIALTARQGLDQNAVDSIWAKHGTDITLMNNIVHLKILTLPYTAPNRTLTARQLEVLEWVGDGKTIQDIAVIMGLTAATVEKHLRLARVSLDVETTAQAVMKAAFANQMFVLDV
ncbi:LuxR family transcriptional regulator [Sulfitobacter sp. F26169L]|uniref:LuxR family transcriptional regulator n=1 Tax=Sulfitobacter sp. F26169L TaxID=2996015 RepID=UPI002260A162|nr:LuxR family transcriptional regulator [Sulfitobacter sp. F26169L]MCX7565488.1 LuxR family transcriptional regulator [Sulfitobacter sp. F26169L]